MALVPCPECKQQVSDRAAVCPRCGVAIAPGAAAVAGGGAGNPLLPWSAAAPGGPEEVVWEGGASPRLLAREVPGLLWSLALPLLVLWGLPILLGAVSGLRHDLRALIHQQGDTIRLLLIGAAILLSLARIARVGVRYAQLKAARYRLTNQRLTIEGGLISKRVDDIDLRLVQDVALEQSALERLLGVGRLDIVSSDHARPRLVLLGIVMPRDVREQIRACAYQASQRQIFTRAT